jgi:hypothetical protein
VTMQQLFPVPALFIRQARTGARGSRDLPAATAATPAPVDPSGSRSAVLRSWYAIRGKAFPDVSGKLWDSRPPAQPEALPTVIKESAFKFLWDSRSG